ncbi:MAG: helix-turn-helix domain-containing protein [Kordiimonadaceae bacterium]|nr:helix-turn-helix domain-containing protein [Kordiimonadaceae bacterium]
MKFGEYIKAKREQLGLTQPDAAAKAQIEQSYLSKLEAGKNYPSDTIFEKLTTLYKLDVKAMSRDIYSAEFDKSRDVSAVRTLVKQRLNTGTRYLRIWLMGGLVSLIVGVATIANQVAQEPTEKEIFKYRSLNVVPTEETIKDFNLGRNVRHPKVLNGKTGHEALSLFKDEHVVELEEHVGKYFVKEVKGGTRIYMRGDRKKNREHQ